jgi:hypothetical protein
MQRDRTRRGSASTSTPTQAATKLDQPVGPADLHIVVEGVELEPSVLRRAERNMLLWLEVDLFGLGKQGTEDLLLTSNKCRPAHEEVPLKIDRQVVCEPDWPVWAPLREALQSEDEQDSDVYFVLRGSKEGGGSVELGSAHVNLEQLQKRGHEPLHERLAVVDAQKRRVALVVVSIRCLEAMRWVAHGADDSCRIGIGVGLLELSAGGRERLGGANSKARGPRPSTLAPPPSPLHPRPSTLASPRLAPHAVPPVPTALPGLQSVLPWPPQPL